MKSVAKLSIAFAAVMVQYVSAENVAGEYDVKCPEGYSLEQGICKMDCDESFSALKESECTKMLGGGMSFDPETNLTLQGCPYCVEYEPEEDSEDLETYEDSELESEEDESTDDKSRLLRGNKHGCPKAYPKSKNSICYKKKCKPLSFFCQKKVYPQPTYDKEIEKWLQDCEECTETFGGETLKNGCPTEWPKKLKGKKKCAKQCDSVAKYCIDMNYGKITNFNGFTLEDCPTCTKELKVNENGCTDDFPKKLGKNKCGKENCPTIPKNCRKTEGPNKRTQEFVNAKDIVFEGCKICTATFDE